MPRRAFDHVCSLVKEKSLRDMNKYTFPDGRLLRLQDRVAVALIVLNSGETPATIGSSVGVNESTASQVTKSFAHAMGGPRWPCTNEKEKIKSKFDKTHGLPNCCGVVHTTRVPFGSQNSDREKKNEDMAMQVVVDSDMRFRSVELEQSYSKNQLSTNWQRSHLFFLCECGIRLNGSKLKVSSGGSEEVGEYIVGDAGYPLRPWLLTPYQLENSLSESELEFNKRHSQATAVALKAVARLKDTWKWLHGRTWRLDEDNLEWAVYACCRLHNIIIDMEEEGAGMPSNRVENNSVREKRQLADEDAVRARDILSRHLLASMSSQSGVDQEEQPEIVASSGSGDRGQ